jgi:hypothetical protein
MADRRTAMAPGAALPPTQPSDAPARDRFETERVQPLAAHAQVPNWFWGALGCLAVLGIGFSVLFVLVRPSGAAAARPAMAAPAATGTSVSAPARSAGIEVEQLAPPAQPRPLPPAAHKARPIKVARSPAPVPRPAAKAGGEGDSTEDQEQALLQPPAARAPAETDSDGDDEPKRKAPARARTAASDSDESDDAPSAP